MKLQVAVDKLFTHKLFSNKYFLYAVIAASVLTNYMHIVASHYEIVGFFILIGIIMMNFSKNVAVVLTVSLLLTQIIMAGRAVREGVENMGGSETSLLEQIKSKKDKIVSMNSELSQKTAQVQTNSAKITAAMQSAQSAEDDVEKVKSKIKNASGAEKARLQNVLNNKTITLDQSKSAYRLLKKQNDEDRRRINILPNLISALQVEVDTLTKKREERKAARNAANATSATPSTNHPTSSSTGNHHLEKFMSATDLAEFKRLKAKNTELAAMFVNAPGEKKKNVGLTVFQIMKKAEEHMKLVQQGPPPTNPDQANMIFKAIQNVTQYMNNYKQIQAIKARAKATKDAAKSSSGVASAPTTSQSISTNVSPAATAAAAARVATAGATIASIKRKNRGHNFLKNNFALLNEEDSDMEDNNEFDFMGPSDMSGLTQGTTNLMTKQKDLFSFMNSMTPLIENAKKMLGGLDLTKLRA